MRPQSGHLHDCAARRGSHFGRRRRHRKLRAVVHGIDKMAIHYVISDRFAATLLMLAAIAAVLAFSCSDAARPSPAHKAADRRLPHFAGIRSYDISRQDYANGLVGILPIKLIMHLVRIFR